MVASLAFVLPASAQDDRPLLQISTQQTDGTGLVIETARVPRPGWIAIHRITRAPGGALSEVIGYARLAGEQLHFTVPLSSPLAPGQELIAALHEDKGVAGTFEFDAGNHYADDLFMVDGAPVAALITTSDEEEGDE